MDQKTFVNRVAKTAGMDPRAAVDLLAGLATVLSERAAELDSVAIPGFGNFVAMKKPESIVVNSETGRRMLMPPKIMVEFVAGGMLKKRVK